MKLSVETFVTVVRKSGLVDQERLNQAVTRHSLSGDTEETAANLANFLVSENLITKWQADKLLQGKHRGYFLGKYKLLSLLGKGGMSSVYLAEHLLMRRQCALKVLPAKRVDDSSYLERFHREAQAAASLDHPNIVRAYDVDHQEEGERQIHFLVMEYVEGSSIQELVPDKGLPSILDAAEYARQAALGLQHAHENGMVHRDIKPGNLLVDLNGIVKILDLGLARFFKVDEGKQALTLRHDEKVLGTADYLAPEQAIDSHTVDARADLYSLGCTLYFMLTGRPPFTEGTLAQRLLAHQVKTPPAVESLRPELPLSLAAIIQKMMAKDPADRYQSAADVERALFDWINENADEIWRRNHPHPYGSRVDSGLNLPKPPVAKPVTMVPANSAAEPAVPSSSSFPFSGPAESRRAAADPAASTTNSHNDTSLNLFLSTLAQSKNDMSAAKLAPSPPVQPTATAEVPKPESRVPLASAEKQPPTAPVFMPVIPPTDEHSSVENATSQVKLPKDAKNPTAIPRQNSVARKKKIATAQVIGVAATLVFGILATYFFSGSSSANKGPDGKSAILTPFPAEKQEVTVGPRGAEYKSIREALIAVRNRYKPASHSSGTMTIKVAAGSYSERIRMDGRTQPWPEGIKLQGVGDVRLTSSGEEPVIRLANLSRFSMENIQIDATDKKVALELADDLHETHLCQLRITKYSDSGIVCKGAQGLSFANNQLLLEGIQFAPLNPQSSGIRLEAGQEHDVNNVIIRSCRFLVPMQAGIVFDDQAPYGIEISHCIFNETSDGIRFDGEPQLKLIRISNNTFRKTRSGIVFTKLPNERSSELVFRRNLFVETQTAEALVKLNYDEPRFRSMLAANPKGVQDNWSDRPKPPKPIDGELALLFENQGRQGEQGLSFASTDPADPKFLGPSEKSPQKEVPGAQGIDSKWVGAIGQ